MTVATLKLVLAASHKAPRVYYRGDNPGDTRRIKTGHSDWDSHLFLTSERHHAESYGKHVTTYHAHPDAKILHHRSRDYQRFAKATTGKNMLEHSADIARQAKEAGYDAVHFERQGDVGTAVFNRHKFIKQDDK